LSSNCLSFRRKRSPFSLFRSLLFNAHRSFCVCFVPKVPPPFPVVYTFLTPATTSQPSFFFPGSRRFFELSLPPQEAFFFFDLRPRPSPRLFRNHPPLPKLSLRISLFLMNTLLFLTTFFREVDRGSRSICGGGFVGGRVLSTRVIFFPPQISRSFV